MPRFVLLYHDCPPGFERTSHWDFMLEDGEVLRTWALERLPVLWRGVWTRTTELHPGCTALSEIDAVVAEPLPDHRPAYLQEEGPLSGNRGQVRRIDAGNYVVSLKSADEWQVTLSGELLKLPIMLRKSPMGWTLTCHSVD